ncbi:Efr3p [Lachancea thermotolerans CBS 6340]|uniref:Protein EFR3 n=1 Tax=Lachancea thermotolerans (strain ATCC 56472 / CBS 6340 / NRRL Y-8284) TaxID=559295 RepID=C5DF58_LACTC|nr:KLTH0D12430p [Lachancea thermotolerans CBS 6340]CAR22813.1 KLTH0D12430p [Lachancea thermotolerans CBS 6340]
MRILFTPKHQKLVNQCYPTGRTPDKKPKSSETSYLLYYVNSRRTKLEKVSTYLAKKCVADLNHRRIGNITVTLELMNKIVNHCKENLNVFVKDFLQIMIKILSNANVNNDVGVLEKVEETFGSICRNLDGAMCNGDTEFIDMFEVFVNLYLEVVTDRLRDDILLLKGCSDISVVTNLAATPQASKLLSRAAELSLTKYQERNPQYRVKNLEASSDQPIAKRLTRTQTQVPGLDDLTNSDDEAVNALRSFFNTAETDKLTLAIKALLKVLLRIPNKSLLQFICNGIPVHLRYIVILIFIRQLDKDKEQSVIVLKLISSLLVSEVSIVGLSILDVMRKLLNTQLAAGATAETSNQCATTIGDLNRKTYYKDQTSDMFSEILLRLRDERNLKFHNILRRDIQELAASTYTPSLSLEMFLDLTAYVDRPLKLFSVVSESVSGSFSISKLFHFIDSLTSEGLQQEFIAAAFSKFKGIALLAGLKHYLEYDSKNNDPYYIYHEEAAKFLGISDYRNQAQYKRKSGERFSRDDLLNYYSDVETNKYSEKGRRIIASNGNNISTTDLVSHSNNNEETHNKESFALPLPSNNNYEYTPKFTVSSDVRSLKTLRYNSPKVKDLKAAELKGAPASKRNGLSRGSQSVKSHITNITFLLSELDDDCNEIKIQDPDDEEVVGLEKTAIARSESLKLLNNASKGAKRLSIPVRLQEDEDDFKDANEDVQITSTRGKLFAA